MVVNLNDRLWELNEKNSENTTEHTDKELLEELHKEISELRKENNELMEKVRLLDD